MRKVTDPERVRRALCETGLQELFDTPNLPFQLFSYDRLELLASPVARLEHLLFVVSGTIPPTGLPLPLISSGNTSLMVTMASMGVLYNISKGQAPQLTLKAPAPYNKISYSRA